MSEVNAGAEFLQQKYQLNADPAVVAAARRHEQRTGEVVKQGDFQTRIQNYLDRLHVIINPPKLEGQHDNFGRQARNLEMIKGALHRSFVTTPEDIPESYYDSIKRRHREEGHGDIEIPQDQRAELAQTVITDQKTSLDAWVDYLASDDAKYPDWLKYFAFRSVLRMGNYDKNKGVFNDRTKGGKTVAPFPELNREALAIVLGDLEKKYSGEKASPNGRTDFEFTGRFDISAEAKQSYLKALENKNFFQLYALAIEEFKPIAEELLKNTQGAWVEYHKGSDPKRLVSSIANYGTGWCLRGEATAGRYLNDNNMYIYYSQDQTGNFTVPRVVMVINQNGNITEVRGVAKDEHLDPYIGQVVDTKLSEPEFEKEGRAYKKKSADMKMLTEVDRKVKAGQELTGEELSFLLEIDAPIEGFGYQKDPRIAELRSKRNTEADMLIVFGCAQDQIAHLPSQIRPDTKAYVGPLEKGIFNRLGNIDHVYTSFPEGKIRRQSIEIGGKTKEQLRVELEQAGVNVSSYAQDMMRSRDFTTLPVAQVVDTVRLKVQDLGLPGYPTTDEVYKRAQELGLDLCPAEVGPQYRMQYADQPLEEWFYIGMKQIADSNGDLDVFFLARDGDGLWLYDAWAGPGHEWAPENEFVFSLRKLSSSTFGSLLSALKR